MKEWILIVGNNPVLLQTRTELLQEWQIVTASSRDAGEAIQARAYDLLIFSRSVLEETANGLIDQARLLYPHLNVVAISAKKEEKCFASATYKVDLSHPNGLRIAVAELLSHLRNASVGIPRWPAPYEKRAFQKGRCRSACKRLIL